MDSGAKDSRLEGPSAQQFLHGRGADSSSDSSSASRSKDRDGRVRTTRSHTYTLPTPSVESQNVELLTRRQPRKICLVLVEHRQLPGSVMAAGRGAHMQVLSKGPLRTWAVRRRWHPSIPPVLGPICCRRPLFIGQPVSPTHRPPWSRK